VFTSAVHARSHASRGIDAWCPSRESLFAVWVLVIVLSSCCGVSAGTIWRVRCWSKGELPGKISHEEAPGLTAGSRSCDGQSTRWGLIELFGGWSSGLIGVVTVSTNPLGDQGGKAASDW